MLRKTPTSNQKSYTRLEKKQYLPKISPFTKPQRHLGSELDIPKSAPLKVNSRQFQNDQQIHLRQITDRPKSKQCPKIFQLDPQMSLLSERSRLSKNSVENSNLDEAKYIFDSQKFSDIQNQEQKKIRQNSVNSTDTSATMARSQKQKMNAIFVKQEQMIDSDCKQRVKTHKPQQETVLSDQNMVSPQAKRQKLREVFEYEFLFRAHISEGKSIWNIKKIKDKKIFNPLKVVINTNDAQDLSFEQNDLKTPQVTECDQEKPQQNQKKHQMIQVIFQYQQIMNNNFDLQQKLDRNKEILQNMMSNYLKLDKMNSIPIKDLNEISNNGERIDHPQFHSPPLQMKKNMIQHIPLTQKNLNKQPIFFESKIDQFSQYNPSIKNEQNEDVQFQDQNQQFEYQANITFQPQQLSNIFDHTFSQNFDQQNQNKQQNNSQNTQINQRLPRKSNLSLQNEFERMNINSPFNLPKQQSIFNKFPRDIFTANLQKRIRN